MHSYRKILFYLVVFLSLCFTSAHSAYPHELQFRNPDCATNIDIDFYPYEIKYHEGFLYISTIGGNASGSGKASLFKVNAKSCKVSGVYEAGSFLSKKKTTHSLLGFVIIKNNAYIVHNRPDKNQAQIDIVNIKTMSLNSSLALGQGTARNISTDKNNLYIAVEGQDTLKKINLKTLDVLNIFNFPKNSKPFRTAVWNKVIITTLFNDDKIYMNSTKDGALLSAIPTEKGAKPNWINDNTEEGVFVGYYGTHKAVKINPYKYKIEMTYNLPFADYPHEAYPILGQLWVGGTTTPTSYIRIFDIKTGILLSSIARGANISKMAFDGGSVWNISANGNKIQRLILDLVWK